MLKILILSVVFLFAIGRTEAQVIKEDAFKNIVLALESEDHDSFVKANIEMDSLASTGYVPALYEMFRTYGWFSDSVSLKRKNMLKIRYERDNYPKYLPLDVNVNKKAVKYLMDIISSIGSTYDNIKAQAYYRLAAYYISDNRVYPTDFSRAKMYLLSSRELALKVKDEDLLKQIDLSLKNINNVDF